MIILTCSTCERRKDYDHPFVKISKPVQLPSSTFCAVEESVFSGNGGHGRGAKVGGGLILMEGAAFLGKGL